MIYIDLKNTFDLCYKNEHGLNIRYISCGYNEFDRDWIHAKRWMESYEILFVTRGEIYIQEEDSQYVVTEGDILILSPFRSSFGYRKSSSHVSFYWVDFDADQLNALHFNSNQAKTANLCKMIDIFQQLVTVSHEPEYPDFADDLIVSLILVEILAAENSEPQKSFGLAKSVAEWVRNNAPSIRSIDAVADRFGYHKDTISKLFKASYKVSLKTFINQEKLSCAKNLLLTSDYSVHQIAEILGYENVNLFIKFFTYHEMASPGSFRKSSLPAGAAAGRLGSSGPRLNSAGRLPQV